MTQVFLSHSSRDATFALRLATDLRSAGIPVWKAPESILEGEEWVPALEHGIATSTHFLLLKSPAAVEAEWVKFEFNAALTLERQGKMRIIPIDYQPCNSPLFWTQFQHVSGIHDEYHATLSRIQDRLQQEQPAHPPEPASAATTLHVTVQKDPTGQLTVAGKNIHYVGQPAEPPPAPVGTRHAVSPPPRPPFEPETVLIPAGPFLMGSPLSDERRYSDEPEQFELNLDYDYAIGKYPVAVREYRAFIEAGGYTDDRYWTDSGWTRRKSEGRTHPYLWDDEKWTGDPDLPVIGVSWYEAYAYTRWLAEATGRDYRLPTESEWEKAARGGLQIPDGKGGMKKNPNPARIWPWGNEPPTKELCNFDFNYQGGRPSPVTSHAAQAKAQPYDLYHMAGNVWEWCLSKWADPFAHPEDNDPEGDSIRVVRGGSWFDSQGYARCSFRLRDFPYFRDLDFGFRVVVVGCSPSP